MKKTVQKTVLSAMFMALGLVLPFVTAQIPQIASMLLPMHIPVLLCGYVCGWQYGLIVGAVTPLFRSFLFGIPVMFPGAVAMAFELAVYGTVTGVLNRLLPRKVWSVYVTLLAAMVSGRIVWGAVRLVIAGITGSAFTWKLFLAGALTQAVPGIVLQLVLIPALVLVLRRAMRGFEI